MEITNDWHYYASYTLTSLPVSDLGTVHLLLSRVHVNVFCNKRVSVPESRIPVERCTFWRSVYCGSALSHHQQAALQPQQPRSIEYAWRNVGEMTSPFYSTPSAGLSVPTTLAISCSARYSLLRYFTRTDRVPEMTQSNSAKSDSPLRLNISATLSVSLEVSWSCEVRLMGFIRCSVKTRPEAGSGGFVLGLCKLILSDICFI